MERDDLQNEINKRITLNLLIQGSAQHAFLTSHYLVRDELNAISPKLLRLYDKLALIAAVQYWYSEFVLFIGWPPRFWRKAQTNRRHPFFHHPLLSKHGAELSNATRERGVARCREKGVTRIPVLISLQLTWVVARIRRLERKHKPELIELAKKTTSMVWGIPPAKLRGELTRQVAFGDISWPKTPAAAMLRAGVAGFGGVMGTAGDFHVEAKAWVWPLLSHEMVKGVVELICMHGLSHLDDATYRKVMRAADKIEFEPWCLQTGEELWRRLLQLMPDDVQIARMVMRLARLPARSLDVLMLSVIEKPELAKELLAGLQALPGD